MNPRRSALACALLAAALTVAALLRGLRALLVAAAVAAVLLSPYAAEYVYDTYFLADHLPPVED